jgi:dolichyl-phosphate-mannose--protein O-mannosyl transferase
MQITKRDLLTIAVLSIIFFGMATWNLGYTQTPTSTATFSSGQSFYLTLDTSEYVGSINFLLEDGSYNLTVYSGSPENWQLVTSGATFSDYYKWNEVRINQATQYLRVDFGESSTNPIIAEVAVTNSSSQLLAIAHITGLDNVNPDLQNLIDEQDKVQLPATYMGQTYFDEIYFVRTAQQYLHLQSPYEWTHPPLGKLIQAAGIVMFGFSPFGWRLIGVIFGTLMIPVMYLLGKRLFGTWIGAFAASFLLTFDFMHFTMARMGTADTYVVFFALVAQLFFFVYFSNVVKKGWSTSVLPLFGAVMFFFLSFSTKWLALYGAVGMLMLLVALRIRDVSRLKASAGRKYAALFDHPFLLLLGFIALGVGMYFLIYVPDMLTGRPFIGTYGNGVIDLQFAMYNYHSTLVATHDFASAWWSWPFMVSTHGYVPLWLDITYLPNNIDSTISVMGNPAVWWVGFGAILIVTERAIRGKELLQGLKKRLSHKERAQTPIPVSAGAPLVPSAMEEVPAETPTVQPEGVEVPPQKVGRRWDIAAIFIATMFFFSWIPYVFISRVTFIYHFYVSVPFLCLACAYLISKHWNSRRGKIVAIALFAAVVVLFAVFYPVISGVPTSTSYIHNLKWFPSWFFAP